MKRVCKHYPGQYYRTYAKDRADMIAIGYNIIDASLIERSVTTNVCGSLQTNIYITGSLVFEK